MTSTPVKDVGSILTNLTPGTGSKAVGIGQVGFQTVLNNQTQKDSQNQVEVKEPVPEKKPAEQPQGKPGDSLKAKDTKKIQPQGTKDVSAEVSESELTPEEMERAMAILETAAADMIQETADLLEIPVEELQTLMEDMGMESLDVLDPAKLSALFVQASGAEDSYALVTDGELYEDYQALMKQLDTVLQESGQKLETEDVQVPELLNKLAEQQTVQKEVPEAEIARDEEPVENKNENPVENKNENPVEVAVQNVSDMAKETEVSDRKSDQKESSSDKEQAGKGETGNVFIQNLKEEAFRPELQQTAEMSAAAETDTENIMRQIMDYMKLQLRADTTNLEMQLHPASLGTVQVQIASKAGAVTANFIAQNEAVKAALESQMVQLTQRFEEQGVKVEAIEVTVQTHEFERNLEQGRGREQQSGESAKKGRTRRINLNDAVSLEDMDAEDALAADIMAVSGNTVDYTA